MSQANNSLDVNKIDGTSFTYSNVGLDNLDNSEYTLAIIAVDVSSSVSSFKHLLEDAIKNAIQACKYSDRADNLLIKLVT